MPLDPQKKLQLYRKIEEDVASGLVLAAEIFEEELGRIIEEKKVKLKEELNKIHA